MPALPASRAGQKGHGAPATLESGAARPI